MRGSEALPGLSDDALQGVTMYRFYVTKVERCHACNGEGWIVHPAWQAAWEQIEPKRLASMKPDELWRWFRGQGYDEIPPEETPCSDCGGIGEVCTEVPLEEALRLLNSTKT